MMKNWQKMIAIDKKLHFLVCYCIAASLYITFGWFWPAVYAAVLAGVIKEWIDNLDDNNYWSWGDIIADLLGVGAFVAQVYLSKIL